MSVRTFATRFAYVADDALVFTHTPQTISRLGAHPADDEFRVKMPRGLPVDDGISELIGLDCVVTVSVRKYAFSSKHARNYGEPITGASYTLVDICPAHN